MNLVALGNDQQRGLGGKPRPDDAYDRGEMIHRLEELECENRRLRDLLSSTPAGRAFVAGPEHRWTYVNQAYISLTGRNSANDFLGKTVRETLPEVEPQGFLDLLERSYRSGEPYFGREVKARLNRAASGQAEEGYFDFLYQPMRDGSGQVEGVSIYAVDVTDQVNARLAVEGYADRLRLAQTAAQIGNWEWDPVREATVISPELHRMFGTDASDPESLKNWIARVHPADRHRVQMLMNEGHRLGEMEFEYRYIHPGLGERWFYCRGIRRAGETRMYGIAQDITLRKHAESDAQRLAAIVACSDDAIISKDLNGVVTSWNAGAERMFGYTAEEMIGKAITKIIPPELYEDEARILEIIARGERIEHFETVRLKKNGEQIEISLTISPVRDESGRTIGAAKIARDITLQKQAERALHTSERLATVGRLAATIAHEINNPLEAVTNLIFLARNAATPDAIENYLAMAEEELERVSHLCKQTLGFYRDTKGSTSVRLGAVVEPLLSIFAPKLRNKGIELCSDFDDSIEVQAVPGEIRQVVANLVGNAIDSLDAGGQMRVRVAPSTQWRGTPKRGVRLSVADSGSGIPAQIREQLFEPFFTTKKDVGTGLGLWICKNIVENHHGTIQVHSSTTPGKSGTVFSVFLPVDERAEHPRQHSDAA